MNCHSVVAVDKPNIIKLTEAYNTGKPIEWERIHSHCPTMRSSRTSGTSAKVSSALDCHGPVETMDKVYQYRKLNMGDCLWQCHRRERWPDGLQRVPPMSREHSNMKQTASHSRRRTLRTATGRRWVNCTVTKRRWPSSTPSSTPSPKSSSSTSRTSKFSLTGDANIISEAAGFVELKVKENGEDNGFSRRDFLKLSGAAMVFATAGCGLRPAEKIIPYINQPEEIMLGVPNYYASASGSAAGNGVLIKTREGRPIKIEGNPNHPLSQGKLDARGQYDIFNLYDPDRLTGPVKMVGGQPAVISWGAADGEIAESIEGFARTHRSFDRHGARSCASKSIADFCESFGADALQLRRLVARDDPQGAGNQLWRGRAAFVSFRQG
jgi:hypothetical protein